MSCNTKTSLAAVIDAVNAQLNNNYVDRDDPRINQGVFTEPTIRGGLMLDEAAKLDFCGYVQECGQREPFGKQWVDRPLYPENILTSFDDGGEVKSRWQNTNETVANTDVGKAYKEELDTRRLAEEGFTYLEDFESGATLTAQGQVLLHEATGRWYRWTGAMPKIVPAGSTPEEAGGISIGAWADVSHQTGGYKPDDGLADGLENTSQFMVITEPREGMRVYVKSAQAYFLFSASNPTPTNTGTVFQGVGGVWEMEIQSAYYASMFCPDSSIDNVNEPQQANINAGHRYAASKGRPFIIDNHYFVKSIQNWTTSTYPPISGELNATSYFAIRVQSNSVLAFQNGGKLTLHPSEDDYGAVLMVFDVENYIILDPVIVGDRDTHLTTTGEQQYCIHLAASKNGYIRNPKLSNSWGDGIYLGFMYWVKPTIDVYVPTNVVIDNPHITNISRNAVSLCGAENLTVNNLYVEDVNRTPPLAGVDIEPEEDINFTEKMFIKNAVFHNATFVGCGYAISQNIFGNRHVEVSFTGITNIVNKGSQTSWIPMLLGSRWLEDNTELNYKQEGYLIIDHVVVSDIGSNLAFKYLMQVDIPENSIKVRIKHYEFTSTNFVPQIMFINTRVVSPKSSGFSVDKFTFNKQINYVEFVFSDPAAAKPKINYNLNFDDSLNIQYQNKGFEFYGSCYIGGWDLVATALWEEKSHINNVIFQPMDDGAGTVTSYGIVTNKDRELFYSLNPKGSEHALGLTVVSPGFTMRSTTDCASIRLVNMSYPTGPKILSLYGNWAG